MRCRLFQCVPGGTGPTSDTGWGCMLRCGQMILGEALVRRHLGRGMTAFLILYRYLFPGAYSKCYCVYPSTLASIIQVIKCTSPNHLRHCSDTNLLLHLYYVFCTKGFQPAIDNGVFVKQTGDGWGASLREKTTSVSSTPSLTRKMATILYIKSVNTDL